MMAVVLPVSPVCMIRALVAALLSATSLSSPTRIATMTTSMAASIPRSPVQRAMSMGLSKQALDILV